MFGNRGPDEAAGPSKAPPARINLHGTHVPVEWLVVRHDEKKYGKALTTPQQRREADRNLSWARSREQWIAAAAAAVHLALFGYNLAFWGFEGMPPDRYLPENIRVKLDIMPGKYGAMDGTKRIYMDNLAAAEGVV